MIELKTLHPESVDRALEKAEQYRLLNVPRLAESICLDILEIQPDHQPATITLLLALTDQFLNDGVEVSRTKVEEVLSRLTEPYDQAYYHGLVLERRAIAALEKRAPGYTVYGWFEKALELYDRANELASPGNDDAILRYNTCARILNRNPSIRPTHHGDLHMTE